MEKKLVEAGDRITRIDRRTNEFVRVLTELFAEFGMRTRATAVPSPPFYFPFGPSFGPAFREEKTFSPGAERFLRQKLFASRAELLSILSGGADTVGQGLLWG